MDARNEILDAIQILIGRALESTTKIYNATCKGLVSGNVALMRVNGVDTRVVFYGDTPDVNKQYRVFVPEGNMSNAFMITGGGTGSSKPTVVDYNALVGKPSINGTTVQGNQTSKDLKLYGDGNQPPYPVTSVNGQTGDVTIEAGGVTSVNAKTGAVVLTQDDVGNGTTYVRTHNDFTDAAKQQINTNKDNIVMLDSDMEAAQGDITTLKGNVTTLTNALGSKQDKIVGGASTITDDNLAANRALVSNGSGKVDASAVTATELGYLDGVTSNIQTQLDNKLESAPVTSVNSKTGAVVLSASDVGAVSTANVTQTLGTSTTKVPSEKAVSDAIGAAGGGDMLKSTYDPNGSVATAGGIPNYVEANGGKIDTIKVNGVAQSIANKEVDITVPTNNNQLANGAGYITASDVPVKSVNGKTGEVELAASDIGALAAPAVMTANRWFKTDAGGNVVLSALPNASTGARGITYLVNSYTRTDTDKAATPKALNDVYKLIPEVTQTLGSSTTKVPSEKAVADALSGAGAGDMLKATYDPTGSVAQAGGIPDYVAGQLPTVNDATLTIQKNGKAVGTFTANASANKSINITMAKGDVGLSNVDNVKQYSVNNPPPYPVTSVAGKTGKVTLTKSNVGLGNVDNVKQYSASNPPPYPVTSVNGKTGAVNLSASDVGAVPTSRTVNGHSLSNNVTITKSDVGLGSVANERQYSANNPPPYPVTSVNGQTGAVEIDVGGGGTTIVLSSSQPSGLKAGDYWYQIVT